MSKQLHSNSSYCLEEYRFALEDNFSKKYLLTPDGIKQSNFTFAPSFSYAGTGISTFGSNPTSHSPTASYFHGDPTVGSFDPR